MRTTRIIRSTLTIAGAALAAVLWSVSPAGATQFSAHRDCDGNVTFESAGVGEGTHGTFSALGVTWQLGPGESRSVPLGVVDGDSLTVVATYTLDDGTTWTEEHQVAIGPAPESCTPPTTAPPTTAPPTTAPPTTAAPTTPAAQSPTWAVDPFCRNDTPYLATSALLTPDLAGLPVTLHWVDSAGNERHTQQVPAGTSEVLWPGAVVDGQGNPTDWPGWILQDGEWVEADDGFAWARSASVFFTVNPTSPTFAAEYPPAEPTCHAGPPAVKILRSSVTPPPAPAPTLPETGGGPGPLPALGAGLLAAGGSLVVIGRQRRIDAERT
jgi:hypothetical protein